MDICLGLIFQEIDRIFFFSIIVVVVVVVLIIQQDKRLVLFKVCLKGGERRVKRGKLYYYFIL